MMASLICTQDEGPTEKDEAFQCGYLPEMLLFGHLTHLQQHSPSQPSSPSPQGNFTVQKSVKLPK